MNIDFPLILVILVFGSGLIWLLDSRRHSRLLLKKSAKHYKNQFPPLLMRSGSRSNVVPLSSPPTWWIAVWFLPVVAHCCAVSTN